MHMSFRFISFIDFDVRSSDIIIVSLREGVIYGAGENYGANESTRYII